jgi:cyclophilin family peptidyl-prolyl cis-trans isomerase
MKKLITFHFALIFMFLANFGQAQTQVTFYTSYGNFVVETYDTLMPITAGNFLSLVGAKFYDHVQFHRVVANFVVQGGDPTGTGYGGPGYSIPDEFSQYTSNVQKALGMANSGPNTGGSQFFINLKNNTYLNPNYPCFGIVKTNFDVVQTIGQVAVNANNHPLVNVYMDSLRVTYWSPAGITENPEQAINLAIAPNPITASSVLTINIKSRKTVTISVYNQQGVEVCSGKQLLVNGFNNIPFNQLISSDLSGGMYFLSVQDGKNCIRQKFIISE